MSVSEGFTPSFTPFLLSILTCLCSFPLSSAASPLLCPSEFLHFRKWDTLIQYTDSWVTGKRTNEIKRHKSEKQEKPLMSLISCCVYSWLVCIFNTYFQLFSMHFPHVSQCICFSIACLSLYLYFLYFSFLFGSYPPFLLICFLAYAPTLFTYLFPFVLSPCRTCNCQIIGIMF